MGERVTYLIEIEQSRPGGDFDGNDLPESMKPMTALQLQRAIAYDLVRIRTAELDPFSGATVNTWDRVIAQERANSGGLPPVLVAVPNPNYNPDENRPFSDAYSSHRPEFG